MIKPSSLSFCPDLEYSVDGITFGKAGVTSPDCFCTTKNRINQVVNIHGLFQFLYVFPSYGAQCLNRDFRHAGKAVRLILNHLREDGSDKASIAEVLTFMLNGICEITLELLVRIPFDFVVCFLHPKPEDVGLVFRHLLKGWSVKR